MARTPQQIAELSEQLAADYVAGLSLAQLAVRYDVAASYAGRLLKRAGVRMRPSAAASPQRRFAWTGLSKTQAREYQARLRAKR